MLELVFYFLFFFFCCGVFSYLFNWGFFLNNLLCLEFLVVMIYTYLNIYFYNLNYDSFFSMYYLVCSVCEGALGLSLLISMSHYFGNDFFKNLNSLMC